MAPADERALLSTAAGPHRPHRSRHDQRQDRGSMRVRSPPDWKAFVLFRVLKLARSSHATLACYKTLLASNPALLHHWERTGYIFTHSSASAGADRSHRSSTSSRSQAKIALQIKDEDELLLLQATAQSLNLCARDIQDAGRTQIAAGSRTVLAIGPGPSFPSLQPTLSASRWLILHHSLDIPGPVKLINQVRHRWPPRPTRSASLTSILFHRSGHRSLEAAIDEPMQILKRWRERECADAVKRTSS